MKSILKVIPTTKIKQKIEEIMQVGFICNLSFVDELLENRPVFKNKRKNDLYRHFLEEWIDDFNSVMYHLHGSKSVEEAIKFLETGVFVFPSTKNKHTILTTITQAFGALADVLCEKSDVNFTKQTGIKIDSGAGICHNLNLLLADCTDENAYVANFLLVSYCLSNFKKIAANKNVADTSYWIDGEDEFEWDTALWVKSSRKSAYEKRFEHAISLVVFMSDFIETAKMTED